MSLFKSKIVLLIITILICFILGEISIRFLNDSDLDGNIIYREVYLTPVMPGEKLSLNNLHFIQSKAELLDKSYPVLQELIEVLVAYPTLHIELSGHTDALGSAEAKKQLAMERVELIKEYLVQYGIDRRRIETVAYGGSRPVAPNDTEEHRSKNRRVEVRVLEVGS